MMRLNTALLTVHFATGDSSAPYWTETRIIYGEEWVDLKIETTIKNYVASHPEEESYSDIVDKVLKDFNVDFGYLELPCIITKYLSHMYI